MYRLTGANFGELITRAFTPHTITVESSGALTGIFNCTAKNLRTSDFDLLRFSACFDEEVHVQDFHDTTHVSMHFQLAGQSNASISCLKNEAPMRQGHFNIFNCVDPTSSFVFPSQKQYEYLCVGLKPAFFDQVLEECGSAYHQILKQSLDKKGFSLYQVAAATHNFQTEVLRLIQNPPVADNLKGSYLRSKVKELIMLSLNAYAVKTDVSREVMSTCDLGRLNEVRSYLSINYLLPLTLEKISRKFLLNEFKLKKGFKALFGQTVFGCIHELRMHHAFVLVNDGGLSISEIAAITGYTSNSSFIRAFRSFYGYSPGTNRAKF